MILFIICLVSSLILGLTYNLVHKRIELQAREEEGQALLVVLPQAKEFAKDQLKDFTYYKGTSDSQLIGYVLRLEAIGYAGPIQMLVGMDKTGLIQGVEILSQQETPGLGSRITEIKPGQNCPWFLEQFKGKDKTKLDLENIQAITGATISSKAVVETVRDNVDKFLLELRP
ncbi:MAG: RnfABCDGE type electron transport complex subunit G [Candidatus Omnitrophota bacterium]